MTVLRYRKLRSMSISAMTMLAYAPILVAMTLVSNVSYIVAFRQASIPIAFLLGILVIKEKSFGVRWLAIAFIIIGLIISALY